MLLPRISTGISRPEEAPTADFRDIVSIESRRPYTTLGGMFHTCDILGLQSYNVKLAYNINTALNVTVEQT